MNDDCLISTLREQNDILRDISKSQKQPKGLVLRTILVFGFGFVCGTINQIFKQVKNEKMNP